MDGGHYHGHDRHPLQGRLSLQGQRVSRYLFGSLASPGAPPLPSQWLQPIVREGFWEKCNDCGAGSWSICCTSIEILRSVESALPLGRTAVESGTTLPAGAMLRRRTQLKIAVEASLESGSRLFFLDSNQTIQLNATDVCVSLYAPANLYEPIAPTNLAPSGQISERSGLVVDAIIGVTRARIEGTPGISTGILTSNTFVAANTRAVIQIPPFASSVVIYQTSAGGAAGVFEMHYGDPTIGSLEVGTIPFIAGARKTQPEILNPDATDIRTDLDAASDRFFAFRWTISP